MAGFLLMLSMVLGSTRNILTKSFSGYSIKRREFFGLQSLIFATGCVVLLFVNIFDFNGISPLTILCALIYGILLLCAQWFYTIALTNGKTAVCATIYSFGFVIPTVSGAIFWEEKISVFGVIGILVVIPALIVSGYNKKNQGDKNNSKAYLIPLIIAMLCSGGLGIVQKIHQKSIYANQRSGLILIAFAFSFLMSIIFFALRQKGEKSLDKKSVGIASTVGGIFACCNLLNTILAGMLDSAVFFPVLNIGLILCSLILGLIIYKERLTKKDIIVFLLGVIAIVLVNL